MSTRKKPWRTYVNGVYEQFLGTLEYPEGTSVENITVEVEDLTPTEREKWDAFVAKEDKKKA